MSAQLFKKLRKFRKQHSLSILELCQQIGAHYTTYHRWKKAQKITGPYKKIIEEFLDKHEPHRTQFQSPITSEIAVIGIACNYPGANNVKELWENILAKRVQFRRIPDKRLSLKDYYNENPKFPDKSYLTKAALIDGFDFSWSKLRIPKKTFESTDIVHWLALDTALKAFEDAGYPNSEIPFQNTGAIVGNTLTGEQTRSQTLRLRWPYVQRVLNATLTNFGVDQRESAQISMEMEKSYKSVFYPITEDSLAGGLANTIAGRICNYLNFKGGGYIVDGACSSSLLAVITAANALKLGEMDLVLAGGVDISLDPFELVGFSKAGALAKDQMRVYDQRASGFIPGEGCGFVVLKRLEDAIRDKNYIYAVIKGWGISSDGKGGIMEPSSSGQATAIHRAYKNSGYRVSDVDFIEGHGTGTTKGDKVEIEGIESAIEEFAGKDKKRLCGITSFKSIVGHTKAAAGVGGLIKAILAVNQRILPPTANCREPNEIFRERARHLYPIIKGETLTQDKAMRAGISSAGFGGINCHVTIESKEGPSDKIKPAIDERSLFVSSQETEIFVFASPSVTHLKKIIQKFKEDLRNISVAEMPDLAALLDKKAKRRAPIKIAVVTDSPEHLYDAINLIEHEIETANLEDGQIRRIKAKDSNTHIILSNNALKNRLGFLFPGQGSQRLNMTRRITERFDWAKDLLAFSRVSLRDYIYKSADLLTKEEQEEFDKKLAETQITQPAVIYSSLVWSKFLSKLGIEPDAVGGHSLGELTAFYKAGAFNEETLIKFAELRGKLMAAKGNLSGSMVSLFCSSDNAKELVEKIGGTILIANINSPNQVVISGGNKEIEQIIELANKEKISTHRLNVSNAFHSSLMKGTSEKLRFTKFLQYTFNPGMVNLYIGTDGRRLTGAVDVSKYFSDQVISPVNFVQLVESMSKDCDVLIEVGPGRVLTDLVKAINKNNEPLCLPVESSAENDRDLNVVLAELFVRNVQIQWEELYKGRLIRPFVPASRKKFIENQCERPLKIVEHREGVAPFDIKPIEHALDTTTESLGQEEAKENVALKGKDGIADLLIDLTNKMTGFDKSSISLGLRLLDDLNLDSIKAAELIAEATKSLGLAGLIDPSQYSNKTLDEIRQKLEELLAEKKESKPHQITQQDILKRYAKDVWVRNFIQKFEPESIMEKDSSVLKSIKNVLIVSDTLSMEIAERLKDDLKELKVRIVTVDEINVDKKPDCMVALLSGGVESGLTNEILHGVMERLHKVIALAMNAKHALFAQLGTGDFSNSHIRALASTLHLERPDLRLRIIDFSQEAKDQFIADKILDELQATTDFTIAAYTLKGVRQVPIFEVSNPVSYKGRNIQWSKKDIVLVSGGAKGITAECALEFARITKAKMVLVGRSAKDKEIATTLERFRKEKLTCDYRQCDVTDFEQVRHVIEDIKKQLGPITAVIHGAGLNSLKRLKQANLEDVYKESLPKIIGAANILEALHGQPIKLFVAMASIIGLTGMEGSGWYGFANEILMQYLRSLKSVHRDIEIIAPAFSVWDEVGMGIKLGSIEKLSERGIGAIPVTEGVKRFKEMIKNDPGAEQVIITSRVAGLDTLRLREFKPSQGWRFIEDIKYYLPGVELISRVHLNTKDDSYVIDHNWKGSLLFPLVFGLEAMAEAACYLTGIREANSFRFKDVNFDRAISVSEQSGTTIEIHALALEDTESKKVRIEIYCEQTNFKESHFSAIIELNPSIKPTAQTVPQDKLKKEIDFNLKTDIYGPILFQGGEFQRLKRIHELYYDEKRKTGECIFQSEFKKPKIDLLIGDPYFFDSVFQSMQLIIPQDSCLPRDIEEIELISHFKHHGSAYRANSSIRRIGADYYRGDANILEDGFILRVKNCRLKILETLPDNPSAKELVNPALRAQRSIKSKLDDLSEKFEFVPPIIRCLYDDRLRRAPKNVRHQIELPLIRAAVTDLLDRDGKKAKNFQIKWDKTGRPLVGGAGLKGVSISLSHDDNFLIVVAGNGKQGCDIETIKERTKSDWIALLGENKSSLLNELSHGNFDVNLAGTSIWGAAEVLRKYSRSPSGILKIEGNYGETFCFSCELLDDGKCSVISTKLNLGKEQIFSIVYVKNSTRNITESSLLGKLGYDEKMFSIEVKENGPQQQMVYIQRFPVTFKNNQLRSKRVNFTSFFEWIGEIREYALYPIMDKITKLTETGGWGLATNWASLYLLGELRANDIVESRLWLERAEGKGDATFDFVFEWRRVLPNGSYERVGISELRSTWVQITGHGEAKPGDLPSFLKEFMDSMLPKSKNKKILDLLPEPLKNISLGEKVGIQGLNKKKEIFQKSFETTLEDSNLVGNIYFANYVKWLARTRDSYFYKINPYYFRDIGQKGEFLSLKTKVIHLQEAMPFDSILVKMFTDNVYLNGLDLVFEFFKIEGNNLKKLAHAENTVIWVKREKEIVVPEKFPEDLRSSIKKDLCK